MFSYIQPLTTRLGAAAIAVMALSTTASALSASFYEYREREFGLGYEYAEHYSVTTTDAIATFDNLTFHFTNAEMWLTATLPVPRACRRMATGP
ncbi:hypothetical protein [Tropicimonas sp.]|uniref:hypothetical protein n=1 Tax=Tropicimonas sp. TaxID=2067044 RepID=UPI003A8B2310